MYLSIFLSLMVSSVVNRMGDATPLMGPANVVIKFAEKCKLSLPTLIDIDLKLYTRREKVIFQTNLTLPYPFSDDLGYDANLAVKRNGGWKPNFMKFRGQGLCSFVKSSAPDLFDTLVDVLKAQRPAKCPLPKGEWILNYSKSDPTDALKRIGVEVMPYGEFRLAWNLTHKGDVIVCYRILIDLVPKKVRGG